LGGPKLYPNSTAVFFSGLELAKMKKKGSLKVYKEVFDKFVWCNQKRVPCLPNFFLQVFFWGGGGVISHSMESNTVARKLLTSTIFSTKD